MVVKDADAAWEQYKLLASESIYKTSLAGQIDTLSSMVRELQNDVGQLMPIVPKIAGDETALNNADSAMPDMGAGMGGGDIYGLSEEELGGDMGMDAPPGETGEEDMPMDVPNEGETMPNTDEENLDEMNEAPAPPEDMGAEGPEMGEEDVPVDLGDDMPAEEPDMPEETAGEDDGMEDDDYFLDNFTADGAPEEETAPEDFAGEPEDTEMDGEQDMTMGEGSIDVPSTDTFGESTMDDMDGGEPSVPLDEVGDNPVMAAYNAFTGKIKEAAHSAIDAGQMDMVNKLADAQATMDSVWGSQMQPLMNQIGKSVKKSDDGIESADAPAMSKDVVTPGTTKAKVDHPIETPSETGKFEDKGGAPRALDNKDVKKSADMAEVGDAESEASAGSLSEESDGDISADAGDSFMKSADEGENEGDLTEFENNDQGAVANTANPKDAGPKFKDKAEFQNTMYKSDGPSIPEAFEIPSFRDFAKGGDTFVDAIQGLNKDSGLGTELCIRKGMGSFGGMAGLIAAQNAVRKGLTEDSAPQPPSMYDVSSDDEYWAHDTPADIPKKEPYGLPGKKPEPYGLPGKKPEPYGLHGTADPNYVPPEADYGTLERDEMESPEEDDEDEDDAHEIIYDDGVIERDFKDPLKDYNEYVDEDVDLSERSMPVEGLENIEASADEDIEPLKPKSGKRIATFSEMMNGHMAKSSNRPAYVSSFGGDVRRPELGNNIQKSASPEVRMGFGVNPRDVTAADWNEYKLYKSRRSS